MAEHGSLSLSQTSEEESSEYSPQSLATLSGAAGTSVNIAGGANSYISLPNPNNPPPSASDSARYSIMGHEPNDQQFFAPTKRPRGRPPGSKNKPKLPVVINQPNEPAQKPIVIEITPGNDVVETLIHFARVRHVGISVLSGSGSVSNVTLRHCPVSPRSPAFPIHTGPFTLLSLSGTYISGHGGATTSTSAPNPSPSAIAWPACSAFAICLVGPQGQIVSGVVGGKVTAAGRVVVVATVFKKYEFHRVTNINGNYGEADNNNVNAYGGGNSNVNNAIISNQNHGMTTTMSMSSSFNVAASNSTPLNNSGPQVPAVNVDNVKAMQWNQSTRPANF